MKISISRAKTGIPNLKKRTGLERTCLNCGKEMWVKKCRIDVHKYCSMKCRGEYWRKTGFYSGEKNPAYGKAYEKSGAGWNRGKALSEKHKEAIRQSHLGEKNHFYGKKHTEETKTKIGEKSKMMYQSFTQSDWERFKERMGKQSLENWKKPEYLEKMFKRRQPRKDTSIERTLQKVLSERQISYTTHKAVVGRPDIFIEPNICIFADGDYWHNKPSQKEVDMVVNVTLELMGMKVIRLWEHDIKTRLDWCINQIVSVL